MEKLAITTNSNKEMLDITAKLSQFINKNKWLDGLLIAFVPHTTAAVTINENADPDVEKDILQHLQSLIPKNSGFNHAEGNSDAHIMTSLFGSSVQIIIENGIMQLGTWQSVFFCEFDGPRNRQLFLEFMKK